MENQNEKRPSGKKETPTHITKNQDGSLTRSIFPPTQREASGNQEESNFLQVSWALGPTSCLRATKQKSMEQGQNWILFQE